MLREPILILAAMLAFGGIHSILAAESAKSSAKKAFGARGVNGLYRLLYNGFAVFSLLPAVLLLATLPDRELYRIPAPFSYVALGVQFVVLLGMAYSVYQLGFTHFSGLRQAWGWLKGIEVHSESDTSASQLVIDGLHRYVRHPLYTNAIVLLWLNSPMTVNRLAFVVSITVYFFVGSIFEERKLVREFGDAYREYQRSVPRLIPRLR